MTPINLNQARKARTRAEAKAKADQNAIRFGRTKAEQLLDAAREQQANDRLTQLKFEDE
ncbi:DUF4169 domain-containing protein [Loktanella sp. D2R18]|uniref:DUF4169 family protein n=1 Tax=Rhodobacterales TaxID=204455 RepID=UPI000DE95FE7|nr:MULTISPECIES: DUF4169 family protein [Rhodobacterales]MDO6590752.1 DUF4169 family protein [Yoonia sp. 1_MG-2023]RBW44630.1 DUF4169 domain-containing protein [Loktanella sp. D2R18]